MIEVSVDLMLAGINLQIDWWIRVQHAAEVITALASVGSRDLLRIGLQVDLVQRVGRLLAVQVCRRVGAAVVMHKAVGSVAVHVHGVDLLVRIRVDRGSFMVLVLGFSEGQKFVMLRRSSDIALITLDLAAVQVDLRLVDTAEVD